jgi:hypothetical protein
VGDHARLEADEERIDGRVVAQLANQLSRRDPEKDCEQRQE